MIRKPLHALLLGLLLVGTFACLDQPSAHEDTLIGRWTLIDPGHHADSLKTLHFTFDLQGNLYIRADDGVQPFDTSITYRIDRNHLLLPRSHEPKPIPFRFDDETPIFTDPYTDEHLAFRRAEAR